MALPLSFEAAGLFPRTWADVDLAAIRHNIRALRRHIAPSQIMAVVKANGYGLGAVAVSKVALEAGAYGLVVSSLEEGQELRRAGISAPILVLGYVLPELAAAVVEADLTLTLTTPEMAQALSGAVMRSRRKHIPLPVHLKLETGLNRYGLSPAENLALARQVATLPGLTLQGLFTHFASADEPDTSFTRQQIRRFSAGRDYLAAHGFTFPQQHLSNSGGAIRFKEARANFVRVGLAMYGYYPSEITASEAHRAGLSLQPCLTLKTQVVRVSTLEPGETVGYSRTYRAETSRQLALLPIGYADGVRRALSNRGEVLVNGKRAPIAGRVSMDQISIDVTGLGDVREGDEVVLIGQQGRENISLEEVADLCDTISYEILTGLGRRVQRVYSD